MRIADGGSRRDTAWAMSEENVRAIKALLTDPTAIECQRPSVSR